MKKYLQVFLKITNYIFIIYYKFLLIYKKPSRANKALSLAKIVSCINGIKESSINSIKNTTVGYKSFRKSVILANLL